MAKTAQLCSMVKRVRKILPKARIGDKLLQALKVGKESYYSIVIDGEVSA